MESLVKLILIFTCLLFFNCSTISVQHDYDTHFDYGTLKTFAWLPPSQKAKNKRAFLTKRVELATNNELQAKGYSIDTRQPDFLIAMHSGTKDRVEVTNYGYAYPGRWGYWGGRRVDVYHYKEGTIILDIIDARSKELIWRGSATGDVNFNTTPEQRDQEVAKAVAKILQKFPPY